MTSKSQARPVWNRMGAILVSALLLAACGLADPVQNYPRKEGDKAIPNPTGERDTVFGPGGLSLFGDDKPEGAGGGGGSGSGIGINSFLWRASLDTLSFMPLNSADPFGGVIITDWYSTPANPEERFKMTVYILDRRLRADGIKVAVFKQTKNAAKDWLSAEVGGDTAVQLENAILVRARQLRLDTLQQ
ncbi:MAG: DUF3576 domain-containing protein [Rhodospirillaceae bacterium]|nr:DUF3576 domain-containing protein [Rhodospirillaceae bacterium]MBT5879897.1 DUF3576 domain-containing protein [Rhodospirillaceae bacterium]